MACFDENLLRARKKEMKRIKELASSTNVGRWGCQERPSNEHLWEKVVCKEETANTPSRALPVVGTEEAQATD